MTIVFFDSERAAFSLEPLSYQFPAGSYDKYDANWLNVRISARLNDRSWSNEEPCLLTWEIDELRLWLKDVALNQPVHSEIDFMEPELRFEWLGENRSLLSIHLNYGLRPPWATYHGPSAVEHFSVEHRLNREQLLRCSEMVYLEAKKFPVRGGDRLDLAMNNNSDD